MILDMILDPAGLSATDKKICNKVANQALKWRPVHRGFQEQTFWIGNENILINGHKKNWFLVTLRFCCRET